jgi:CPA1 family monovalent cation:H+ antiporter
VLSLFDFSALLITLTALFSWLNHRFVRLPRNIGLLVMGLASATVLVLVEYAFPGLNIAGAVTGAIRQIDFHEALMNGMLAFLLFAGALHVDWQALRSRAVLVGVLATAGVAISTVLVGLGFYGLAWVLGLDLPLAWALVFGALISPTDPVAVMSTLQGIALPKELKADIAGESLFNDGVGVVIFTVLLGLAGSGAAASAPGVALFLVREALGGMLLGLVTGYVAYRAMRSIDDYPIEILISLALVTGTYAVAGPLHVSGPIAVVVAGLLTGTRGPVDAMSDLTQRYLFGFWGLVDEMLNAVLFLLVGLELIALRFQPALAWLALAAIPLVLLARFVAVAVPVSAFPRHQFARGSIAVLTWGGVRGGISVALALSLPEVAARSPILAATYAVVVFTIVVQGLSMPGAVRAFTGAAPLDTGTPGHVPSER